MRKAYPLLVILFVITAAIITLTSGISKDGRYGGGNVVEEFYELSVKQNENLRAVEDAIDKFYRKKDESLEKYNSYTHYNNRYYTDARAKAATIADAATRQKATDLINKSETRYTGKLTAWKNEIAALNEKERELRDLHALLKVVSTEPQIERYQRSAFPDNSKLTEANSDLQQVLEKIKAITN